MQDQILHGEWDTGKRTACSIGERLIEELSDECFECWVHGFDSLACRLLDLACGDLPAAYQLCKTDGVILDILRKIHFLLQSRSQTPPVPTRALLARFKDAIERRLRSSAEL